MRKIYISLLCVVAALFYVASVSGQYVEPQRTLDIPAVTAAAPITIDGVGDETSLHCRSDYADRKKSRCS